jgi:hypothetical protein
MRVMTVRGGPALPIKKMDLVIDSPLQAGGVRQAWRHTEAVL